MKNCRKEERKRDWQKRRKFAIIRLIVVFTQMSNGRSRFGKRRDKREIFSQCSPRMRVQRFSVFPEHRFPRLCNELHQLDVNHVFSPTNSISGSCTPWALVSSWKGSCRRVITFAPTRPTFSSTLPTCTCSLAFKC